jgi:hypothetical protein
MRAIWLLCVDAKRLLRFNTFARPAGILLRRFNGGNANVLRIFAGTGEYRFPPFIVFLPQPWPIPHRNVPATII